MGKKQCLLDPIASVCKLISLRFCKPNTKISIQNHIIKLQKPNKYQGLLRLYNADGREDISELYYVVVRLIKWYLVPSDKSDDDVYQLSKNTYFRKLIMYLCEAFQMIQQTYDEGNVVFVLQYYINLLLDGLDGKYNKKYLPMHIVEGSKENLLDYNKIKTLWTVDKIKRICELYENCYSVSTDKLKDDDTKDAFIKGYIRSVNTILELIDKEFRRLIINSNKG